MGDTYLCCQRCKKPVRIGYWFGGLHLCEGNKFEHPQGLDIVPAPQPKKKKKKEPRRG